MAYLEDFYDALRAAVAAAWPDVTAVYEAEQQEMIPWADLTPPCAAIVISSMPKAGDGDWGLTWSAFTPQVELYYVASVAGGSANIRAKLEALRDALLATGLTAGQVLDVDDLCWSDDLEANQIMIAKDYGQRAGRVMATCLIGEVYP